MLEQWKEELLKQKDFCVAKMTRLWQSIFYLLKYEREEICERDTNKIEWKKVREIINEDFLQRLTSYTPFGSKMDEYKVY